MIAPGSAHLPEKGGKLWQVPAFGPRKGTTCQKNPPKRGRSLLLGPEKAPPARKTRQNVAGRIFFDSKSTNLLQKAAKLQEVEFLSEVRKPPRAVEWGSVKSGCGTSCKKRQNCKRLNFCLRFEGHRGPWDWVQ